jgi:hypothetical protein
MQTYLVWTIDARPEAGKRIVAASSFEARRICARSWGRAISEVVARRA